MEIKGTGLPDVWWFRPDGRKMTRSDWQRGDRARRRHVPERARDPPLPAAHGEDVVDDSFVLLFNAHERGP